MLPLKQYISNPSKIFSSFLRKFGRYIPDKQYLQLLYFFETGKRLNLKCPRTFGEKIQWLKLYDRRPKYTMMVDKYAVKDYVEKIIGEDYVIPTLGVWDRPEDINFEELPQQFVLKTTHGGGSTGVIICKDKTSFNINTAILFLKKAMNYEIFKGWREWPYKNVRHRIIAEKYVSNEYDELKDYKFFCFNGTPWFCQVISNRETTMSIDFFDMEWNHLPLHEPKQYPFSSQIIPPPKCLTEMHKIAQLLSFGIPFLRIDLYEVNNHPYFGELTFYPTSGMGGFSPEEWDFIFGDLIQLPKS